MFFMTGYVQTSLVDSPKLEPLKPETRKYKTITRSIANFIVKDLRPIATVEVEGFQEMFKTIEPRYQKFPCNRTIVNQHIIPMYHDMKDKVST